jgi:hypothetical protein
LHNIAWIYFHQISTQKVRRPNFYTLLKKLKGLKLIFFLLTLFYFVSFMRVHPNVIHEIPCIQIHNKVISFILVSSCVSYVGFTKSLMTFFHGCANMVWTTKGFGGPPWLILCSSYRESVCLWHYTKHRPPPSQGVLLM